MLTLQFLEVPDQIVILREASGMPRRVYMDGRGSIQMTRAELKGPSADLRDGEIALVDMDRA